VQAAASSVVVLNWPPGPAQLARGRRLEVDRLTGGSRVRRFGSEKCPARRTELGLLPYHAGLDASDVRDLGTAKPERVAHAGLLLLHRVGPAFRRAKATRDRNRYRQTEPDPRGTGGNGEHESPKSWRLPLFEIRAHRRPSEVWVNRAALASKQKRTRFRLVWKSQRTRVCNRAGRVVAFRSGANFGFAWHGLSKRPLSAYLWSCTGGLALVVSHSRWRRSDFRGNPCRICPAPFG
jgi:hypothetical protein